jgi:predicted neutral ceramidase superfamily lipid hydrolase
MANEFNPYAPPRALDDVHVSTEATADLAPYYTIPPVKMVLMSLASFGLFDTYWLYRQWKAVRARTGDNISPFWRTVFAILFVNSLFGHIRRDSASASVPALLSTGVLSAIFIIVSLIGRIESTTATGLVWIIGCFAVVPLVIVQQEINQYQAVVTPDFNRNARWGFGNVITLLLGALGWTGVVLAAAQAR